MRLYLSRFAHSTRTSLSNTSRDRFSFRTLPEWLRLLWSVDSLKANFVLLVVSVQDGDGIAIGNTNDTAGQGVGVGCAAEEEHQRK
jgi:hypothetical protein